MSNQSLILGAIAAVVQLACIIIAFVLWEWWPACMPLGIVVVIGTLLGILAGGDYLFGGEEGYSKLILVGIIVLCIFASLSIGFVASAQAGGVTAIILAVALCLTFLVAGIYRGHYVWDWGREKPRKSKAPGRAKNLEPKSG